MKISRFELALAVICTLTTALAAQGRLLTIDDIFSPDAARRINFYGQPSFLEWAPDGHSFRSKIGGRLMRINADDGRAVPYFDSDTMQSALEQAGISAADAAELANSGELRFTSDERGILVSYGNDLWYYNVPAHAVKRLTNSPNDAKVEEDMSPDGKWASFVRGNNLYVVDVAKGTEKQLTRDGRLGDKAIYNGYLDWLYEEELFGRGDKRGYWWSPDSKYIAFLRLDESPVPKFVIANDVQTTQLVDRTDYPRPGEPNPLVRLGIADVNRTSLVPNAGRIPKVGGRLPPTLLRVGDAVRFVDIPQYKPEDLLIGRVAWSNDSTTVTFQALNREQTWLDLDMAGLDGKTRRFLQETTPASVELYDNPIQLKGSGQIIWQSARNGWRHIYLYDNRGQLIRQLTNGKWEVRNIYGVDEKNGWVYFSGTKDSYIAENVYRVRLSGGEVERLTQGDGTHSAEFNHEMTEFADVWSDVATPPETRLFSADGKLIRVVNANKVGALSELKLSRPEFLRVPTRDGFVMEAMMIKPPDFDPSKRYPVLEYTYAGPHSQSVVDQFDGEQGMWFQLLAQKGYVIWVCDNRSASGKGEESVWPIYKRFGELELRDHEDGINYLKALPYIDGSRVGLFGWSFGGFMTSYALTHSHAYKLGISGGTVSDWRLYDSIYTERYMGTPADNPDGYRRSSVIEAAKNLSGKLLLIHGDIDNNVHKQNTIMLAYELQEQGKQFDMMLYPNSTHGVSDPAQVRHLYTMMTDYIVRNL